MYAHTPAHVRATCYLQLVTALWTSQCKSGVWRRISGCLVMTQNVILDRSNGVTWVQTPPIARIYKTLCTGKVGRVSSVCIATRYGLDSPGIESRWRPDFPHPFTLSLVVTRPPAQCEPDLFFRGVQQSGHSVDHLNHRG
jgi:hypothetical protein